MHSSQGKQSWLGAVKEAATREQFALPPFTEAAMGSAICHAQSGGRFVSFKRRLVPASRAVSEGVKWTLWLEVEDQPCAVAVFREPLTPTPERVSAILSVLHGWLIDRWPVEKAEQVAASQGNARVARIVPPNRGKNEYWLSSDHAFGIIVENDRWGMYSRGNSQSVWRSKSGDDLGDRLPISSLDRLCVWLARNWTAIAYGKDIRPALLRERTVAATRAYDDAQLLQPTVGQDIASWWSRHAIRAATDELPNVFLERQADELVVSWDARPSGTRFYNISNGEEAVPVAFAVPILRRLVRARLKLASLKENERAQLLAATSGEADAAYTLLSEYKPSISKDWLVAQGFSEDDARDFAIAGTSRHPIVGLLRSSQDSPIFTEDYEKVLQLLSPSDSRSYRRLRDVANGMSAAIDVREPWESGYRLAKLVREKLERAPSEHFDVETVAGLLGVHVCDLPLGDTAILGACIGSPAYAPLILLNPSCQDACGVSGRRITIAHELCHLLFDRSRMQSLSRFEGQGANSDRLIEMRANAFAVELLVPMSTLIGEGGTLPKDEELQRLSVERQVSLAALSWHVANLRSRLARHY